MVPRTLSSFFVCLLSFGTSLFPYPEGIGHIRRGGLARQPLHDLAQLLRKACNSYNSERLVPLVTATLASDTFKSIGEALPFLDDTSLLAEDVTYRGLGLSISGVAQYVNAASNWRRMLPQRLDNLQYNNKSILPPDSSGNIKFRYTMSFDAPIPLAVLPGQRERLDSAELQETTKGKTRVTASVVGTLVVDAESGLVRRHAEQLVGDPLAVRVSIAHYELLKARTIVMSPASELPLPFRETLAYWNALRGMMRIELEEIRRRQKEYDELSVLPDEVTDEEFESQFRYYILLFFFLPLSPLAVAIFLKLVTLLQSS